MVALCYPYFTIILLIVSAITIYKRRYLLGVVLIVLCLALNCYAKVFAVGISDSSNNVGLNVLTFNINGSGFTADKDIEDLFNLIVNQEADILFLAEDFEPAGEKLNSLLTNLYPYSTYNKQTLWKGHFFYSKYPLGKVEHININSTKFSYCFQCNMVYGQDSISLYGCHMASNNYKITEPSIRPEDIDGVSSLTQYFENINLASKQRCEEAMSIILHSGFNAKSIVMGDFNDVSGSEPLKLLEDAGLKDAWWEKGYGYGATISHPLPYRIDHIMYREGLKLKSIRKIDAHGLSDHDALMATFEY